MVSNLQVATRSNWKQRVARYAATAAVKYGKRKVTEYINKPYKKHTPTKKAMDIDVKRSRASTVSATSGGRITTKKNRTPKYQRGLRDGYGSVLEVGQVFSGADVVGVGHITHPANAICGNLAAILFKKLLNMSGVPVYSRDSTLPFNNGDQVVVNYRISEIATVNSDIFTVSAATSLNTYIQHFTAPARPWNTNNNAQITFVTAILKISSLNAEMNGCSIPLANFMVKMAVKSTLKIQNRTINSAGNDEADEVDNSPVYGKVYAGKGTGAQFLPFNNASQLSFCGDQTSGIIAPTAASIASIAEPQPTSTFTKVTRSGRINLDPGVIKTSTLNHTANKPFSEWMRQCGASVPSNFGLRLVGDVGKFQFMMIEKMIDATTGGLPVVIAAQHNLEINTSCSMKKVYHCIQAHLKYYVT